MFAMSFIEVLSIVLPVISFIFFFIILSLNFYLKIRRKFPINVNCWFCNKWSTVPYHLQNAWDCRFCEQYNGFNENGDYNKPIPAQHDELMNKQLPSSRFITPTPDNGLCNSCNNNQQLKIHQLAAFSPIDENKFDEEIEIYKKQLERAYRLCPQCEATVKSTLSKQKSIVLGERLSHLRKQGLSYLNLNISQPGISKTAKLNLFLTAIRYTSVLLATIRFVQILKTFNFFNNHFPNLFPNAVTPYILLAKDVFLVIYNFVVSLWQYFFHLHLVLFDNYFSATSEFLKSNIPNSVYHGLMENADFSMTNFNGTVILTSTGVFLQLTLLMFNSNIRILDITKCAIWFLLIYIDSVQPNKKISYMTASLKITEALLCLFLIAIPSSTKPTKKHKKKIVKKHIQQTNEFSDDEVESETSLISTFKSQHENKLNNSFESSRPNSAFEISSSTMKLFNVPFKKNDSDMTHIFGQQPIFENPLNVSYFKYSPKYRSENSSNESLFTRKSFVSDSLNDSFYGLNDSITYSPSEATCLHSTELDLNKGLSDLHLSSAPHMNKPSYSDIPPVFRVSSPLLTRPKPVLSPPRLRNVTQSSWVAGGYWKSNEYLNNCGSFSNLSRSSSQSSGFGSQTSSQQHNSENVVFNSLPPSRNNSVCGEFDKYSVFSEPAYHPKVARNMYSQSRCYPVLKPDQQVYISPKSFVDYKLYNVANKTSNAMGGGVWSSVGETLRHPTYFNTTYSPESNLSACSLNKNPFNSSVISSNAFTSHPQSIFSDKSRPVSVNSNFSQTHIRGSLLEKWRSQHNMEGC